MKNIFYQLAKAFLISTLPILATAQEVFRGEIYYPIPPSSKGVVKTTPYTDNNLVRYDLHSKIEKIIQYSKKKRDASKRISGNKGAGNLLRTETSSSSHRSAGPLVPVENPYEFPYSMNVKLFIKQGDNNWVCSGSLIDSRHVLTSGQCVFNNGWVDNIFIVPAYYFDYQNGQAVRPFGEAIAANYLYSWSGWTINGDLEWNMGLVFFDRPIGALTGWFGIGSNTSVDFYDQSTFYNVSYPAEDPYDGNNMFIRLVNMSYYHSYIYPPGTDSLYVYHTDYSFEGQRGSSYYIDFFGDRYIYGVLSHWNYLPDPTGVDHTGIAHIHHNQFDDILNIFSDNLPDETDLIPLRTRAAPESVVAGYMLEGFDFYIHNYSESTFNEEIQVEAFLSADKNVTHDDISIGIITTEAVSIPSKGTLNVIMTGNYPAIPWDTPEGDYYLGVIIGDIDVHTGNNITGIWDLDSIRVIEEEKPILSLYSQNRFFSQPYLMVYSGPDGSSSKGKICADGSKTTTIFQLYNYCQDMGNYSLRIKEDINAENPEVYGSLKPFAGEECEKSWYYEHPTGVYDDFGPSFPSMDLYKEIHIQVINTTDGVVQVEMPVHIYRAPVTMVHGLWDSDLSFKEIDVSLTQGNWLLTPLWVPELTYRVDYSKTHANSFDDNRDVVLNGVKESILQAFYKGFSVSRVNLVAHSMGGLLSRIFLQSENYENDVCRLVTINTPHSGTQAANYLRGNGCLGVWLSVANRPVNLGAVENLQFNSNALWGPQGLNREFVMVPSHAIATSEIPPITDPSASQLYGLIGFCQLGVSGDEVYNFVTSNIFGESLHDLIVPLESQYGGLDVAHLSLVPSQWHNSLQNDLTISYVHNLLNADPGGAHFSQTGFRPPMLNYSFNTPANISEFGTGTVEIIAPISGSEFLPGTEINVEVEGTEDIVRNWFLASSASVETYYDIRDEQNAGFAYEIPSSAIGPIRLAAIGLSDSSFVDVDTIQINVIPDAQVDSIWTNLQTIYVTEGSLVNVMAIALFDDGIERNISELAEVSYFIEDTTIARLHSPGLIRGLVTDTTGLTISYQDYTAFVDIVVLPGDSSQALELLLLHKSNISCQDGEDGVINVGANGGTPNYSYSWSDGATGPIQYNLIAGTYIITATDASNNSSILEVVLTEPEPIHIIVDELIPEMNGNINGQINISVEGGNGEPYLIEWFKNGEFFSNSEDLDHLSNGEYLVIVTDSLGCTAQEIITLGTTQASKINIKHQVKLHPNPTSGEIVLQIDWLNPNEIKLEVYDLNGRTVMQKNVRVSESKIYKFDISTLPPSIYLAKVTIGGISSWHKVVKSP